MKKAALADTRWLRNGGEFLAALLAAIHGARRSVRLETYIVAPDATGTSVRAALTAAAARSVSVRVLVDALGSAELPADFWEPLRAAGGEVRVFNPLTQRRLLVRNHRKLLVGDDDVAIVGGFNIADAYTGDGIVSGWADCGLILEGPSVAALVRSFDRMLGRCDERPWRTLPARLRKGDRPPAEVIAALTQLLESGPGRGPSAFQRQLHHEVAQARAVRFVSAYFLPGFRLRWLLRRAAKRGASVQIIVPGKSDVAVSQRAAHHLYAGLLRAGVELWEYQPQVLHAKLFLAHHTAFVGSSNLDPRSLHLNYELMLGLGGPQDLAGAHEVFARLLAHSRRIDPATWRRSRSWWEKLREQWAFWLLSRLDPYVTHRWFQPRR